MYDWLEPLQFLSHNNVTKERFKLRGCLAKFWMSALYALQSCGCDPEVAAIESHVNVCLSKRNPKDLPSIRIRISQRIHECVGIQVHVEWGVDATHAR